MAGKLPTPVQLAEGQIAVNFSAADPFLTIKDSAGAIRKIAGFSLGTTAPLAATTGTAWLDTTRAAAPTLRVFDSINWLPVGGSGVAAGTTAPSAPLKADLWVDTNGADPTLKVYNGLAWAAVDTHAPVATTSVPGIAQLATTADVTVGASDRVVTADLLKATNDSITAAAGGGVTNVLGTSPVVVTPTGTTRTIGITSASTTAAGVIRLATTTEITTGTATDLAVNPAQLKAVKDSVTTLVGAAITGVTGQAPITATATGSDVGLTFDPIPLTPLP